MMIGSGQDGSQERHSDVHAVLRLSEIGGARIRVELSRDFLLSRQRMHDDHFLLGARHQLRRHAKVTAGAQVFFFRREPLSGEGDKGRRREGKGGKRKGRGKEREKEGKEEGREERVER